MPARYGTRVATMGKSEAVRQLIAEYEEEVSEFMESALVTPLKQSSAGHGFKKLAEATCICTPEGRIVYVNGQLQGILGYTMRELVDENVGMLFVTAGDIDTIKKEIDGRGYIIDFRTRLYGKDGSVLTCYISSTIRWYNDETVPGNQPLVKSWLRITR